MSQATAMRESAGGTIVSTFDTRGGGVDSTKS
jgi:hypothetical protein